MTEVGVVVVHFGDVEPTRRCLAALQADPSPVERFVVVVDNSDNLGGWEWPTGTCRLPRPDNPGFGAGANHGADELARRHDRTLYVILNHDVEIQPGFLGAAASVIGSRQAGRQPVGAAGGPVRRDHPDGPLWSAGGHLNWITGTVVQNTSEATAAVSRDVTFLPGAALAVAPRAWRDVGGFDPVFFLYHEDLDLCLRLRRAGWRLRFEPRMEAVHHVGAATGSAEASPVYLEHLTRTRLRCHPSRPYRLYLAALHSAWVLVRAARYSVRNRAGDRDRVKALLAGHLDAVRSALS